jgi:signal transduction histidine kinase
MSIYVILAKNKTVLHSNFLIFIFACMIWSVTVMLKEVYSNTDAQMIFWENMTYFGAASVPVSLFILAKSYAQSGSGFTKKYYMLYIVPLITMIIIWTNQAHGLFFHQYPIGLQEPEYGIYFYFHAAYSYVCMLSGIVMLTYYAFKNSGILSVQALLITLGSLAPFVVNLLYTFRIKGFDTYSTPIANTFLLAMYLLGMFRFNFLKVSPIALQTVINRISDSFIVLDKEMNVLDFNYSFMENFKYLGSLKKGVNLKLMDTGVEEGQLGPPDFCEMAGSAIELNTTQIRDVVSELEGVKQYYTVETTPIFQRNACIAVVLLFKNITQHIRDMEKIKENQAILLERERLASLGQLIGGIAHNLKTPIMSIAGGIEQLQHLTREYETSVGDEEVTAEDHAEIAQDMLQWLGKMKIQTGYMSDIISTVKDQASKFTNPKHVWFTLDEMLKRVKILMQHEIVKNQCRFTQDIRVDKKTKIPGDVNSLVQILDNVIVNAIQAYDDEGGEIILQVTSEGNKLLITVCDFGKGIDDKVKDRLFKEMITTKGKHGTGLGLYMSHSTVKGMFRGNMWFESSVGQGTKFYIQLPLYDEQTAEVQDA